MLVNVPVMAAVGVLARPVTTVLFGERWLVSAPILQVLSLGAIVWPMHVINVYVLVARGEARLVWHAEVVKKVVGLVLLGLGATQGLFGIAWATVVVGFLAMIVNGYLTGREIGYGFWSQVRDVLPVFAAAGAMTLAVSLVHHWWRGSQILELATLGPLLLVGEVLILLATGSSLVSEVMMTLKSRDQEGNGP